MPVEFYIYFTVLAVNLIYGLLFYRSLKPPYKTIILLVLITLISEIAGRILAVKMRNSCPPYHFYLPLQYILFCVIYNQFIKQKFLFYYSIVSAIILLAFNIINSLHFQIISKVPSNSLLVNGLFTIFLVLYTYAQMLKKTSPVPLYQQGLFWFNMANFIYFTITFCFWAFFNYLIKFKQMPDFIAITIITVTILTYILYGIALTVSKKEKN